MWIIGITGAIGAGKSTFAEQFQKLGVPMHSADKEIHSILSREDVQQKIKDLWPEAFVKGKFNRERLRDYVLKGTTRLTALETLLYPELAKSQRSFLDENAGSPVVVLDIPLLIEVELQKYCHFVAVVETPFELRKNRVLHRKGMSIEKFEKLESNQTSEERRREYADAIIQTGRSKTGLLRKAKDILSSLSEKPSPPWGGKWPDTFKKGPLC